MELSQAAQQKLRKLQEYEHQVQGLALQRQRLDNQVAEIDSALESLKGKPKGGVFKIIGNVMVAAEPEQLQRELQDEKNKLKLRADALEKQQEQLKAVADALQKEVLKHMGGDWNG